MTVAQRPLVSSRATRMPAKGLLFSSTGQQSGSKGRQGQNKTPTKSALGLVAGGEAQLAAAAAVSSPESDHVPLPEGSTPGDDQSMPSAAGSRVPEPLTSSDPPATTSEVANGLAIRVRSGSELQPERMLWSAAWVHEALQQLKDLQDQANKLIAGEEAPTPPPPRLRQSPPCHPPAVGSELALSGTPMAMAKAGTGRRTPARSVRCQAGQSTVVVDKQKEFATSVLEQIRRLQDEAAAML